MTIHFQSPVSEAMNFSAALTNACERSGAAGICTNLLHDALATMPQDPRILKLAELFAAQTLGNKSTAVSHEIADLTLELEAEAFFRDI